jgi:hypothetical protein
LLRSCSLAPPRTFSSLFIITISWHTLALLTVVRF